MLGFSFSLSPGNPIFNVVSNGQPDLLLYSSNGQFSLSTTYDGVSTTIASTNVATTGSAQGVMGVYCEDRSLLTEFDAHASHITNLPSLSAFPNLTTVDFSDNFATVASNFSVPTSLLTADFSDNMLESVEVDAILAAFVAAGGVNGTLNLSGTDAAPTATGAAHAATLTARGWTVAVNAWDDLDITYSATPHTVTLTDPDRSLRENAIVWHPVAEKYYMCTDVTEVSNPIHPDTYDTDIHLMSSVDLINWTYHGVCIGHGDVGEIGHWGVCAPAGIAYHDGKIYCPFSAANNAGYSGRNIGLAWSGADPEVLPWTQTTVAVSNTSGEDSDPACVSIPGDPALHLYHRSAGSATVTGYHIVHTSSPTPEIPSSWAAPVACTVNPEPGVTAQELTAAVWHKWRVHLFIMEHQGSHSGTAHLASHNPSDTDFSQYSATTRMISNISNMVYNGHFGITLLNDEPQAYSWTVLIDGGPKYGLEFRMAT